MAQVALPRYPRLSVPVSTILTVVVPPLYVGDHDQVILELENLGTDTFSGTIWSSLDGADPWVPFADDSFATMLPGPGQVPRWARVPGDLLWVRVTGTFAAVSGNMRRAAILVAKYK